MDDALNMAGIALQVGGVLVAGVGVWRTWREFGAGESFFEPITSLAYWMVARSRSLARRIATRLGRKPAPQTISIQGIGSAEAFGSATLRVGWPPLPTDGELALAELHRRTKLISEGLANAEERLGQAVQVNRDEVAALRRRISEVADQLGHQSRRVAIGGLRYQALGLFLVSAGLALQGIAGAT